ncbi:unannotated protein [freshwater metagenome]|uniref:Unannotated protein n=1 Tax=freshwater metagenome TaxID=449393 RepID=A0A6J6DG56_9ZZZZ
MPSVVRTFATSLNSKKTSQVQRLSCSSRTIAQPKTFCLRPTRLFQITLIDHPRTYGPLPETAKRLLATPVTRRTMRPSSLPMKSTKYTAKTKAMTQLPTETSRSSIEPTLRLEHLKIFSFALPFLTALSAALSFTSVKKSKTPWPIWLPSPTPAMT